MNNISELRTSLLSNFCNLITVRLDNSNYVTWKFLLETLLRGCGLMKYIEGSFPCPPRHMVREEDGVTSDMTEEYMNWVQTDSAVMSLLSATLSSAALSCVVGSKNSWEVWKTLRERYGVSRSTAMQLKTNLYTIQKGTETIDKYFERIKGITDQLATVGINIPDEEIIFIAANGLPSEYKVIKFMIKTEITYMSLNELRSFLLDEESIMDQPAQAIQVPHIATMVSGSVSPTVAISQSGYVGNTAPPSAAVVTNPGFTNTHVMPASTSYLSAYNTAALMNNGSSVPSSSSVMNPVPSSTYMVPNVSHNGVINAATQFGVGGYLSLPPQYNNFTPQSTTRAYCEPSFFNAQNDGGMQVHYGGFQQIQNYSQHSDNSNTNDDFSTQHNGGYTLHNARNFNQNNDSGYSADNSSYLTFPPNRGFNTISSKHDNFKTRNNNNGNGNQNFGNPIVCQICEKLGHGAYKCYFMNSQPQIGTSTSSVICQICKRSGHSAYEHYHTKSPLSVPALPTLHPALFPPG